MKKIIILGVCMCAPFMVNAQKGKEVKVSTVQKIAKSGEIVVAVREDQFPFSYLDEAGNARGYTVELCENIIKDIRKQLDIHKLKIVYFPITEGEAGVLFKKKVLDLDCGNAYIGKYSGRNKSMDFTNPFLGVEARILTSQTNTARSLSDFNNQVVSVVKNSALEGTLSSYLKAGTHFYRLKVVNSLDEGVQSLVNGNSKAFVSDDILLLSVLADNKSLANSFKITGFPITSKEYGFAYPVGDVEFGNVLNGIMKKKLEDGVIHNIYEKWFLQPIPPYNINLDFGMSKSTKELLNKMR